jgi:hypothetical protein
MIEISRCYWEETLGTFALHFANETLIGKQADKLNIKDSMVLQHWLLANKWSFDIRGYS